MKEFLKKKRKKKKLERRRIANVFMGVDILFETEKCADCRVCK